MPLAFRDGICGTPLLYEQDTRVRAFIARWALGRSMPLIIFPYPPLICLRVTLGREGAIVRLPLFARPRRHTYKWHKLCLKGEKSQALHPLPALTLTLILALDAPS